MGRRVCSTELKILKQDQHIYWSLMVQAIVVVVVVGAAATMEAKDQPQTRVIW